MTEKKLQPVAGSGGGKSGGGRKPVEAPNTLHSIASAQIIDLVSEGPIVGFATDDPLQSIYYDETPVANPNGSLNFKDVQIEYRYGTQDQEYVKGFPSVENEILANVELRQDNPFVRSITNTELSAIRLRLAVPGLSKIDEETNDVTGHTVHYAIDLATETGSNFVNVLSTSFNGKTTTRYARSHRIDLPPSDTGWTLRVRRITPHADSATVNDTVIVEATTEIVDAKLRYPNSALVATKINAEQFPGIPRRAFDLVGRIVRVPSNYDPIARTYDGIWDGTFKPEWTDNPAWIYYDAVLHDRYGLGHRIQPHQVDQWALYRIARICDELVPDGKGGMEPRYTCNIFIQEQVDAYRLLRDLASVFNGIAYYADNRIIAGIDAPTDSVVAYTNADVVEGRFTYSGSGKSTRATVALVTWYDPNDFYRPRIEPVVDDAGVARYGIEQIELIATGCTSQGQAQRAGWWALLTGRLETEAVSFSLGLDGTFAMPGQIIKIADEKRAGQRIGGRVVASTQNTLTVDDATGIAPTAGDHVSAMMANGFVEKREITQVEGNVLTVAPFTTPPMVGGAWILETTELVASTWRVIGVTEAAGEGDDGSGMTFNISAVEHVPEKFAAIDGGVLIEGPPTTQLPSNVQLAPAYVALSAVERAGRVVASPMLAIEWPQTAGAVRYGVAYRRTDGDWQELPTTTATRVEIENVFKGVYLAQVWAYNAAGVVSERRTSEPFQFDDQTMLPEVIGEHDDRIEYTEAELIAQQAAIDQEIADRIAEDLRVAGEAAADATAKADAVRDDAQAAADALNLRADQLRDDIDATMAQLNDILGAEEWDAGTAYAEGALVQFDGKLYRAIQNVTAGTPTSNAAYWELIGEYASLGDAVAAALSELSAHADELGAHAESLDLLGAKNGAGTAWMLDMQTVRVSASETMAQWRNSIQSAFGDANARIDAEETARADGDSALATTLATVQATADNAATKAELTAEQTARADGDSALSERIDLTQASIGQSILLMNPDFELEESGWQEHAYAVGNPDAPLPANVDIYRAGGALAHTGSCALRVSPPATAVATNVYNSNRFSAGPGDVVGGSIRMRTHYTSPPPAGTRVVWGVRWYKADNEFNGDRTLGEYTFGGSENYFYSYDDLEGDSEAPPDTAYGRLFIRISAEFFGAPGALYFDAAQARRGGTVATATDLSLVRTEVTQQGDTLTALGERVDLTEASLGRVVLVQNGSFERGMEGWTSSQPDAWSVVETASAYHGKSVLQSAVTGSSFIRSNVTFEVKGGDRVHLRAFVRAAGTSDSSVARIAVRWGDADGNLISNGAAPVSYSYTSGAYVWEEIGGEVVAPANAVSGWVILWVTNASTMLLYWDQVEAELLSATEQAIATDLSLVSTEVTQHGTTLTAHALRMDNQQTDIDGKASTSYVQSVEGIAQAADGRSSSNLTAINGLTATAGNHTASITQLMEVSAATNDAGGVGILDPGFERYDGWGTGSPDFEVPSTTLPTDTGWGTSATSPQYVHSGDKSLRFNPSPGARNVGNNVWLRVMPGRRYRITYWYRTWSGAPNSGAFIRPTVYRFDSSGNFNGYSSAGAPATVTFDGSTSAGWTKVTHVYTVASTDGILRWSMQCQNFTGGALGIFVDDFTVELISEVESALMARHTVALDVNGRVSGTVNENDGQSSSFSILATVFRVISGGNAGLEWQNGYLRAYALGAQVVLGSNFGSTNDLMIWAGPNVGANSCTKANGLFWVDNTGDGYFAGRVLQGMLRWFNSTNSTAANASTTTGSNPRLGKSVSLAVRYQFSEFWDYTGGTVTPGSGGTAATIVIERRYGSGSWTTLVTRNIQGTSSAYNNPPDPPSWSVNIDGNIYATDTASTTDSEYRARITSRSTQNHSPGTGGQPVVRNQYLSIEAME